MHPTWTLVEVSPTLLKLHLISSLITACQHLEFRLMAMTSTTHLPKTLNQHELEMMDRCLTNDPLKKDTGEQKHW